MVSPVRGKSRYGFSPKIIQLDGNVWSVERRGSLLIGRERNGTKETIHAINTTNSANKALQKLGSDDKMHTNVLFFPQ
jgi:hypothetical protein